MVDVAAVIDAAVAGVSVARLSPDESEGLAGTNVPNFALSFVSEIKTKPCELNAGSALEPGAPTGTGPGMCSHPHTYCSLAPNGRR